MLVRCPHCGPRDQTEFLWGDDAAVARPPAPAHIADDAWTDYLYFRAHQQGVLHERWCHVHGCGTWFVLARDTLTHRWLDG